MATRWHWKQTFTSYDDKRYQRKEDYHSLAYGHSEATPLVSLKETITRYREYLKEHKEEIVENERLREKERKNYLKNSTRFSRWKKRALRSTSLLIWNREEQSRFSSTVNSREEFENDF